MLAEYCVLVRILPKQKHIVQPLSLYLCVVYSISVSNVHIALELDIVVNAGVKRSDSGYKISTIFLVT